MESLKHHVIAVVDGLSTCYVEQADRGSAPSLVLLHGWGESKRAFVRLLTALLATTHVVVPDLRGHGGADKPTTGYRLPELASDVIAIMDLLASGVGGFGGRLQRRLPRPSRLRSAMQRGSPVSSLPARHVRYRAAHPSPDDIEQLTDPVSPSWVRGFTTGFLVGSDVPGWYVDLMVREALRIPAHAWRASLAGLNDSVPPTMLGTVTAPTLIPSGGRDNLLSRDEFRALASVIPASRWLEYADAGHLVLWEQPERLARDITMWLAQRAALH
jgi:pimeloyl-ACP methyl ester carboxylesterase